MKCLNVGCGARFHPAWVNLDAVSRSPCVREHDCRNGIPFDDNYFDVSYHSHVLEHFEVSEAAKFIKECFRVLRPGGTIRVAVPDLEQLAQLYLRALQKSVIGDAQWQQNYEWLMLELYDQVARHRSGGEMLEYIRKAGESRQDFIMSRAGGEIRGLQEADKLRSIKDANVVPFSTRVSRKIAALPHRVRERFIRMVLGEDEYKALAVGRFRLGGEVHLWMYDRHSLSLLLSQAGFENIERCGADQSRIPGWSGYQLDTEADGSIYKPDSIFMEGVKPM